MPGVRELESHLPWTKSAIRGLKAELGHAVRNIQHVQFLRGANEKTIIS